MELISNGISKVSKDVSNVHTVLNEHWTLTIKVIDQFKLLVLSQHKQKWKAFTGNVIKLVNFRWDNVRGGLSLKSLGFSVSTGIVWCLVLLEDKRTLFSNNLALVEYQFVEREVEVIIATYENQLMTQVVINHAYNAVVAEDTRVIAVEWCRGEWHTKAVGVVLVLSQSCLNISR